jgi:FHS family L-fucose permease-like MFS transporter
LNIAPVTTASGSSNPTTKHAVFLPPGRLVPFILVTALFFLWGIPNNLNDILIRQFMKSFEINRLEAGLVQSAFYLGYFLLAVPAGQIMRRAGYKAGILIGLCLYGSGCILFWPAALVARYWFFLMALFVIASGLAFLETAASSFIVQIGPVETAEQRLTFSQAFNPVGSVSAVLIGARFIFSGVELNKAQVTAMQVAGTYQNYLRGETLRVVAPYIGLGAVVLFWAVLIARTKFPHVGLDYSAQEAAGASGRSIWKRKHFTGAVAAQFLYVGAQVSVWSYMIAYMMNYAHLHERVAGYWLMSALIAFTLGRFTSTWLLKYISANKLLLYFALVNISVCTIAALHPGWLGVWCLVVNSFFMSPMYPTIFALGVKGLGPHTKTGGSVIVMSIVGGAVVTPVMGKTADMFGVATGYLVPMLCFVGVALYAAFASLPEAEEMIAESARALSD